MNHTHPQNEPPIRPARVGVSLAALFLSLSSLAFSQGEISLQSGTFATTAGSTATATSVDTYSYSNTITSIATTSTATSAAGNSFSAATTSVSTAPTGIAGTGSATSSVSFGVVLRDIISPKLTLLGGLEVNVFEGDPYVDPGVRAYDDHDGDLSAAIIRTGSVNVFLPGTYVLTYTVSDREGNEVRSARIVHVLPRSIPAPGETPSLFLEKQTDILRERMRRANLSQVKENDARPVPPPSPSVSGSPPPASLLPVPQEPPAVVLGQILGRGADVAEDVSRNSDADGLSDFDERAIYKTDPHNADSDGDGYSDGSEILSGFNPLDPSPTATIRYENPRNEGETRTDILGISSIAAVPENVSDSLHDRGSLAIQGRAVPLSLVTVYVFSIPTVVTTRAGADGSWEYVFDEELPDGEHEVFVAMTDGGGRILGKSIGVPFVKEANAVTVTDPSTLSPAPAAPSFFNASYLYLLITAIATALLATIFFIGQKTKALHLVRDEIHS